MFNLLTRVCPQIHGLNGRNYRLYKDNLEKDIVPSESTYSVKANKVVVKLKKVRSVLECNGKSFIRFYLVG